MKRGSIGHRNWSRNVTTHLRKVSWRRWQSRPRRNRCNGPNAVRQAKRRHFEFARVILAIIRADFDVRTFKIVCGRAFVDAANPKIKLRSWRFALGLQLNLPPFHWWGIFARLRTRRHVPQQCPSRLVTLYTSHETRLRAPPHTPTCASTVVGGAVLFPLHTLKAFSLLF